MAAFDYSPIPIYSSAGQIRLLVVHPRAQHRSNQIVECSLEIVSLADKPFYGALSYTWGDATVRRPIKIDGIHVDVTTNLEDALRQISHGRSGPMRLWVDAVCINQQDDAEKSEQVQQMKHIYANAAMVVVWLGPAADDSDWIMDKLNEVGTEAFLAGAADLSSKDLAGVAGRAVDSSVLASLERVRAKYGTMIFGRPYRRLLRRAWWSRVWVVQELATSQEAVFRCGHKELPYASFLAAFLYTQWASQRKLQTMVPIEVLDLETMAKKMAEIKEIQDKTKNMSPFPSVVIGIRNNNDGKQTLSELLIRINVSAARLGAGGYRATDPKDKVYGLLGLASDSDVLKITPDYAESTACGDVYVQTARAIIESGQTDLLALAQRPKFEQDLPSWVPDWRGHIRNTSGGHTSDKRYCTGSGRSASVYPGSIHKGIETLVLGGLRVGTVVEIGHNWKHKADADIDWNAVRVYMTEIEDYLVRSGQRSDGVYQSADQLQQAIWRVPIMDQERNELGLARRATSFAHEGYRTVMDMLNTLRISEECQAGNYANYDPVAFAAMYEWYRANTLSMSCYTAVLTDLRYHIPFMTAEGYVGVTQAPLRPGDVICVIFGAMMPYALRKVGGGKYKLIGEIYLHGICDGELLKKGSEDEVVFELC